jgi:mono/diheme cytochrome c family protein
MPVFNMSDEEAFALTVALRSHTKGYVPTSYRQPAGAFQPQVDDGRFLAHWHNCVGCHKVEGSGGYVLDQLRAQMGLRGDDINPYGPPNLNTAGAKLQEEWFYGFVSDPSSRPVRDWLKIRMPTYGFTPGEVSRLAKYFLGLEDETLQFTDYSFYPAADGSVEAGRVLFERLKCNQCHARGSEPATGGATAVPAPNLALGGNRLKPEWISRWIRDPQMVAPGTKMPNFFGTFDNQVAADPEILGGDWQAQVNALRDYVWRIGGPKGGAVIRATTDTAAKKPQAPGTVAGTKRTDSAAGKKISMR